MDTKLKLIAGLLIKNEANRYLRECLDDLTQYVDGFVILDNGSTDDSIEICSSYKKCLEVKTDSTDFKVNELYLRKLLFELICKYNPEWILMIDADEVFESKFKTEVKKIMAATDFFWFSFIHLHFWGDKIHYRIDKLWKPHNSAIRLCRYAPDFSYNWGITPFACGSLPFNIFYQPGKRTDIVVKHYGYANPDDIKKKYEFYKEQDPLGRYHAKEHLESIGDKVVSLVQWNDCN